MMVMMLQVPWPNVPWPGFPWPGPGWPTVASQQFLCADQPANLFCSDFEATGCVADGFSGAGNGNVDCDEATTDLTRGGLESVDFDGTATAGSTVFSTPNFATGVIWCFRLLVRNQPNGSGGSFIRTRTAAPALAFPRVGVDGAGDMQVECDGAANTQLGLVGDSDWHQLQIEWDESSGDADLELDGGVIAGCNGAPGLDVAQLFLRDFPSAGSGMMADNMLVTEGACP